MVDSLFIVLPFYFKFNGIDFVFAVTYFSYHLAHTHFKGYI